MRENAVRGLLSLDLLLLLNNFSVWLFYLALALALWPSFRSAVLLMMRLGHSPDARVHCVESRRLPSAGPPGGGR